MAKSRTIDSTQFNLQQLQQLEVERIQQELEAKKRRHEQELARREAAARAIEQAQIDAQRATEEALRAEARRREEARLQAEHTARIEKIKAEAEERARQQEIELRNANAQMLQAQAMLEPKRRLWPVLLLAVVFGLQGLGFMWYQGKAEASKDAIAVELSRAEQRAADAAHNAKELAGALAYAQDEIEALEAAVDERPATAPEADDNADSKAEAKKDPKKDPKKDAHRGDSRNDTKTPPKDDGRIDLSKCDIHSPLGCIKR